MKHLFLALIPLTMAFQSLAQQNGPDPREEFHADNGYDPDIIRKPVLPGDNIGRTLYTGWLSQAEKWYPGAEIKAVVAGQPGASFLPADLIFSTGAQTLKNRFKIGSTGLVSVNSDDQPAQFSVTQYNGQNAANSPLFLARGGKSGNEKVFRLFNDGLLLSALLQGNLTVESGDADIKDGNMFVRKGRLVVGVDSLQGSYMAYIDGPAAAKCLTITGGCDWWEFSAARGDIQPGEVVVIDPSGAANSVKRSARAYDPQVAGVVSGAGGINPGIGLTQAGELGGNVKIAMGGKVKVRITGKVRPGDLLTSSAVPGRAMAAKNRKKAFGAVIGKALSTPDDQGLVLMLVMMR